MFGAIAVSRVLKDEVPCCRYSRDSRMVTAGVEIYLRWLVAVLDVYFYGLFLMAFCLCHLLLIYFRPGLQAASSQVHMYQQLYDCMKDSCKVTGIV